MSLKGILSQKMNRPYLDATLTDTTEDNLSLREDWTQFIRDYLPWLRARATVMNITETVMPRVRFNLRRYLLEKGVQSQLWWIVLELNNFKNDMDFDRNQYPRDGEDNNDVYMRLLLPAQEDIASLHDLWLTTSQVSNARSSLVTSL